MMKADEFNYEFKSENFFSLLIEHWLKFGAFLFTKLFDAAKIVISVIFVPILKIFTIELMTVFVQTALKYLNRC